MPALVALMRRAKQKPEGWVLIGLPCASCRSLQPLGAFQIEPGFFAYDCSNCRARDGVPATVSHQEEVAAAMGEVLNTFTQRRQLLVDQRKQTMATLIESARRQGSYRMPEEVAVALRKFPDRVAAIVGKTFEVMGADAFDRGLTDDVAVARIVDLLNELDETLIPRNKSKSLARLKRVS